MSAPAAPIHRRPVRATDDGLDGLDDLSLDRLAHVGESAPGALLHRRPHGHPGIGCSMPAAPRCLPAAPAATPIAEPAAIPGFLRAPARAGSRIDSQTST